jgi:hypothetical protein
MYCKDCSYRDEHGSCTNKKICELGDDVDTSSDQLIYCYNESGGFTAQDFFGCVHFKQKTT